MDALMGLLKDMLTSQPILQVFAGAIALMVIAYMVLRGQGDRVHAAGPAGAPAPLTDVPAIFAQGPRETLDTLREIREAARRGVEEIERLADDVRVIRDDGRRRNEILDRIEREWAVTNRIMGQNRP